MARKKKPELPPAGRAFAFPIGDGRYSVCRVLLDTTSEQSKQWRGDTILVACSSWIGSEIPVAGEPAVRPILHLNHHAWVNKPNILWISDEPPQELIPIEAIDPTPEERQFSCLSFGSWSSLMLQPLAQWRWDNQRDAVLTEDSIQEKAEAAARVSAQQEDERRLGEITLDELRRRKFFPNWKSYPPMKAVRASRRVMSITVQDLIKLGRLASEKQRMAVLQKCIEAFNELDAEMRFIETVEREDICKEFEAIVHACGLGGHISLADEWRDW
jgi:hypothetical protein